MESRAENTIKVFSEISKLGNEYGALETMVASYLWTRYGDETLYRSNEQIKEIMEIIIHNDGSIFDETLNDKVEEIFNG